MKKIGEFWVPDVDLRIWSRFGKKRRKTIESYSSGGPKLQDLEEALAIVPRGSIAIDGGANVGAYTRMLAGHFDTVYAFEPASDTFACLQRNIQEWGLGDRVIARNAALSDVIEKVGLSLRRGGRSLSRTISGPGDVDAVTIDSLGFETVDFIKLDVEGYEYRALAGARDTLCRCQPAVLFEDKPGKIRDPSEVDRDPHAYLKSLGAHMVGSIGPNGFDWLYRFER